MKFSCGTRKSVLCGAYRWRAVTSSVRARCNGKHPASARCAPRLSRRSSMHRSCPSRDTSRSRRATPVPRTWPGNRRRSSRLRFLRRTLAAPPKAFGRSPHPPHYNVARRLPPQTDRSAATSGAALRDCDPPPPPPPPPGAPGAPGASGPPGPANPPRAPRGRLNAVPVCDEASAPGPNIHAVRNRIGTRCKRTRDRGNRVAAEGLIRDRVRGRREDTAVRIRNVARRKG